MLCSLLQSMCPSNLNSNRNHANLSSPSLYSHLFTLKTPARRTHLQSPPPSPRTLSMTSVSISTSVPSSPTSPSTMTLPMSSITPPGSPPSPTMSMESIHGHPHQLETALQKQQRKLRVMIVDDNSINLAVLSRMLDHHFADTVELAAVMASGVAALEKLNSEPVDLILMDIDMPELTGVETTAAIRQNSPERPILEENQKVPIIAVTTSDGDAQRELYLQVGMSDCVSKPIDIQKLRSAIESAFKSSVELADG